MKETIFSSLDVVTCGCNRTTQALSWSRNGLVAYGGCNSVFIYNLEIQDSSGQVIAVLNGHTGRVNCVQWLNDEEIISGSSDNSIIIWKKIDSDWTVKQQLLGHSNAICSLSSVTLCDSETNVSLIASAASDSTLKIWQKQVGNVYECVQDISFGNGFVHATAMISLPNNKGVVLACGCDDTVIKLYAYENQKFKEVLNLSGHEDWVRSLAFTETVDKDAVLLASCSQDTYIRLWKITTTNTTQQQTTNDLVLEEEAFVCNGQKFTVVLESVLIGHEGWVLGISWSPFQTNITSLLSASMDKTMILWTFDEENQVWIDKARMGDVGGITLGYYGCAFGPTDQIIISHGYHGAFRVWSYDKTEDQWKSCVTISGHFGEIEDFDWDPAGEFAITASTDQTTRLYALWKREAYKSTWHEIARPQVHGYDMKCITMLGRFKYASGAQEKVVRVFAAPKAFYESFSCISNVKQDEKIIESMPVGATVPVLGLSNKAVYESDIETWSDSKEQQQQPMKASAFANEDPIPFNPTLISVPPVEDVLVQNTLWPEVRKLYGHGFELFTIASSPDGNVLATACKASKADYANILIWDTRSWTQQDSLFAHTLTVTQLCFSPCGTFLLSVSRDRTWALHRRDAENKFKYHLVQKTDKKTSIHTRIIWSCAWSHDSKYFFTASRDKKVLVWSCKDEVWSVHGDALDHGEAITAISVFHRKTNKQRYLVSLGTESGCLSVYTFDDNVTPSWNLIHHVPKSLSPTLTVKRLRWRPSNIDEENVLQLGVCSSDHSFRIITFPSSILL